MIILINLFLRIFEGPIMDLSYKYSNLMKIMLVTAFYAYEIPIIILFAIGNIILTYFIEKVKFYQKSNV